MEVDIRLCSSDAAMQENLASLLATRTQGSVFIGFLAQELSFKTTVFCCGCVMPMAARCVVLLKGKVL